MASNCLTNGKGRLDTNKLSLLHSKLIKTFPDKRYKNSEQGKVNLLNFQEFPNLRVMAIRIGENYFAESFEYEEETY